jgi:hypothetical protein
VYPLPAASAELFLAGVTALRRDREYNGQLLERARLVPVSAALTGLPHDFPDRG